VRFLRRDPAHPAPLLVARHGPLERHSRQDFLVPAPAPGPMSRGLSECASAAQDGPISEDLAVAGDAGLGAVAKCAHETTPFPRAVAIAIPHASYWCSSRFSAPASNRITAACVDDF
jgi:hypothetical protein